MSDTLRAPSSLFYGPIKFLTPDGGEVTLGVASSEDDYSFTLFEPPGDENYMVVTSPTGLTYLPFVPFQPLGTADKTIQAPLIIERPTTQGSGTVLRLRFPDPIGPSISDIDITASASNSYFSVSGNLHFSGNITFSSPLPVAQGGTGVTTLMGLATALAVPLRFSENNTSNRNLTAADNGGLFRAQTGTASIRYNLPSIDTCPDGWTATFVKGQAPNSMFVRPVGSDFIGNMISTSAELSWTNIYTSITIVKAGAARWFVSSYFNGLMIT